MEGKGKGPIAAFKGPTSKGRGGMKGEGKGREEEARGGEGRGMTPHKCWNLGPSYLATLLVVAPRGIPHKPKYVAILWLVFQYSQL